MQASTSSPRRRPRQTLIRDHIDVARRIARKIGRRLPSTVGREDLESAALLGLTEAAAGYDPSRREPFVAYAVKRVRGAVLDELRRNDPLTRRGRQKARLLSEASHAVEAETGQPATLEELARRLSTTVAEVSCDRARLEAAIVIPLHEVREAPRETEHAPDYQVCLGRQLRALAAALERLPERDRQILALYYTEGRTLKHIGEVMGVTESRVSQLHSRSLARLREAFSVSPRAQGLRADVSRRAA